MLFLVPNESVFWLREIKEKFINLLVPAFESSFESFHSCGKSNQEICPRDGKHHLSIYRVPGFRANPTFWSNC